MSADPVSAPAPGEAGLERRMGPAMLAFYGLGSMLGAGVYGLMGKAAGVMGAAVWAAFLVAMAAALLTGLSYAALGARYPRAGGASYVVGRAFKRPALSYAVGLAVVASGLSSMATGSKVVAANLQELFGWAAAPVYLIAAVYLALLAGLVWRGLSESLWVNALCTVVEVLGLLAVIVFGARFLGSADLTELPAATAEPAMITVLLAQGAVLTFFAFIGFEDTLNVAEEVKDPARSLPIGILAAMGAATLIYIGVAVTAVSVVPWRELAAAPAPLGAVMARAAPWLPPTTYTIITIFAVANTALINFIMGSRLVYGMARQGLLPRWLGAVDPARRTPHRAVGAVLLVALAIAAMGDVSQLAAATVLLLLTVFVLMNVALLTLQRRPGEARGPFEPPAFVPALGALICGALLLVRSFSGDIRAPLIAGGLVLAALALYVLTRETSAKLAGEGEAS